MSSYTQPVPNTASGQVENPDSLGSWIVAVLLSYIPVVGFIYLIFLAFGQTASPARKNWARATFILQIIAYVLTIGLFVTVGIGGAIAWSSASNAALA